MTLAHERRKRFFPEFLNQFLPKKDLPDGLTPELVADLFDLVSRHGRPHEEENTYVLWTEKPVTMYLMVKYVMPRPYTLTALGEIETGQEVPIFIRELQGGGTLNWDIRLSASMAEDFIGGFDETLAGLGFIDADTGVRKLWPNPRFGVDKIFTRPGVIFHLLPGEPDAKTIRQEFDHPEHVAIVPCGPGASLMCLIGEREATAEYVPFVESVYLEHNIATAEDFKRPAEDLDVLQDDIRRVLKKPSAQ